LWRIWPGDVALTLNWLSTTDFQTDGSRVTVLIRESAPWTVSSHAIRGLMERLGNSLSGATRILVSSY